MLIHIVHICIDVCVGVHFGLPFADARGSWLEASPKWHMSPAKHIGDLIFGLRGVTLDQLYLTAGTGALQSISGKARDHNNKVTKRITLYYIYNQYLIDILTMKRIIMLMMTTLAGESQLHLW